ncbi:unnamed protein product [Brassica rapa]|uniref:Uncharacterized protein n=1 Tax=Brassica campestris TaxID=3711 RepID=A0A8D9HJT5_BRACM|nr:unnamed protein product [Brassica rapa]
MANASSLHVTEEREEVMFSEKGHTFSKAHFLKPIATSCEAVAELPRQRHSVSSSPTKLLNSLSSRDSVSGFWVAERRFVSWVGKMEALHEPTWRKAGIFEAIKASTYNITKNPSLLLSVSQKCSEMRDAVVKLEKSWQEKKAGHDIVREEPRISASWVEVIWSMKLSL